MSLRSLLVPVAYSSIVIEIELSMRRGLPTVKFCGFQSHSQGMDILERVKTALYRLKERLPNMSIAVNLSPVDIKKSGSYLDLPIFVAFMRLLRPDIQALENSWLAPGRPLQNSFLYLGELSLSGSIKPISHILPLLFEAKKNGFTHVLLPADNLAIAQLIPDLLYIPLRETSDLLRPVAATFPPRNTTTIVVGKKNNSRQNGQLNPPLSAHPMMQMKSPVSKLNGLKYSPILQRALALAAGGWHSSLLIGPPGCGKSSFAREVAALLPLPDETEAVEILINRPDLWKSPSSGMEIERPLRTPHHSSTRRALIGGGSPLRPGEITFAHHGVLILDELAEFSRDTLNAMREPLESRELHLSIGREHVVWPARFLLCASANPCPCGDIRNRPRCSCTDHSLRQYHRKFMGALKNRIDIIFEIDPDQTDQQACDEQSIRSLVHNARAMQERRFAQSPWRTNSDIPFHSLERQMPIEGAHPNQVWSKIQKYPKFSYRMIASIRRMARTLADMDLREQITAEDLILACSFKSMNWDDA